MIFVLRQIQKKYREQNMGLYAAFVDLTKAFDTVSRDGLWKILACLDCPPKFLTILHQLHKAGSGEAQWVSVGSFPNSNSVKQGCVLAPTLSSIFLSIMLREEKEDLPDGIYIRFRTDGSLSTFGVSSHARKPAINSSLSCCLLTTPPFSPTRRKP